MENLLLYLTCFVAGGLALAFFIAVFVADWSDAQRRAKAKRADERARKHLARAARKSESKRQAGV
jgi:uncharacterized membrane protein YccC